MDTSTTDHLWITNPNISSGSKVFETTDGGSTWADRNTDILNGHKIRDIVFQLESNNIVYIVSQTDLFYWDESISDWVSYNNGLPLMIKPLSLIPFYRDAKLRLSSNRGIWEAPFAGVES